MREALIFTVASETLATPVSAVNEVLRAAWPIRLPRAPFGCLGLLDVRGQMVPLIDLAVMLGLRVPMRVQALAEEILNSHVLRVDAGGMDLGFLVDRVIEVGEEAGELTEAERSRAFAIGRTPVLFQGVASAGGARILMIDLSKVLGMGRLELLRRRATAPRLES